MGDQLVHFVTIPPRLSALRALSYVGGKRIHGCIEGRGGGEAVFGGEARGPVGMDEERGLVFGLVPERTEDFQASFGSGDLDPFIPSIAQESE